VVNNLGTVDRESVGHCSVCGCVTELVELLGRIDKFCLECSGDVATAILLAAEIDAAMLSGRIRTNWCLNSLRSAAGCSSERYPQN
jgi:hypothetical protein